MGITVEEEGGIEHLQAELQTLNDALERESVDEVRALLADLHPAEIAWLLESLPHEDRDIVWDLLDSTVHGEVLAEAEDQVRVAHLLRMDTEALAAVAAELDTDDAADLLQDLPEAIIDDVLRSMDLQQRARLEAALAYPEDTAGGLMDPDTLTVRADVSLEVVQRYLRLKAEVPEHTDRIVVVDRGNRYQGTVPLVKLLVAPSDALVRDVLDTSIEGIHVLTSASDVARIFEHHDLISAPVIDDGGYLLGHISVDDVVDLIRDEGEHSLMSMAGLDEEDDMFAPVLTSARRRTLWLGINLATALLAAWVIGLFEATLEQVVALAVLMPVVASMGGIAGGQTLTVVIRGMALGQLGQTNIRWLLFKEVLVGLVNSALWALVVTVITTLWFDDWRLGAVIGVALVANLVVAALAGASIPLILRRMSIDPALAGGVLLTTVTDVIGFVTFLGLGTLFLLG